MTTPDAIARAAAAEAAWRNEVGYCLNHPNDTTMFRDTYPGGCPEVLAKATAQGTPAPAWAPAILSTGKFRTFSKTPPVATGTPTLRDMILGGPGFKDPSPGDAAVDAVVEDEIAAIAFGAPVPTVDDGLIYPENGGMIVPEDTQGDLAARSAWDSTYKPLLVGGTLGFAAAVLFLKKDQILSSMKRNPLLRDFMKGRRRVRKYAAGRAR